jgi:hypothetical protein
MIVGRAPTEMPGEGIIDSVVAQIQSSIPGSDSEAVVYPATLDNYVSSKSTGVASFQEVNQEIRKSPMYIFPLWMVRTLRMIPSTLRPMA